PSFCGNFHSTSRVRTATSCKRACASLISSRVTIGKLLKLSELLLWTARKRAHENSVPGTRMLNLQYHRHNQRPFLRLLGNVALQISPNLFLDDAIVGLFFVARIFQRLHHDLPRPAHEAVFAGSESPRNNFR